MALTGDQAERHLSEVCGSVASRCSDTAGILHLAIGSSERLRGEYSELENTVADMEADQQVVAEAADESRVLSENAIHRLEDGASLISSSLNDVGELISLVDALSSHITSFAAAMAQVQQCTKSIEDISETTNILALNASIEAMRAGDSGKTFAVVAGEVKALAGDAKSATDEISETLEALSKQADHVVSQVEAGAKASGNAKLSISKIEDTVQNVEDLVKQSDHQAEQISKATSTITTHVESVRSRLATFRAAAGENETSLHRAHENMDELELEACEMFDRIVKDGLSERDLELVAIAKAGAEKVRARTQPALKSGELTVDGLFDQQYRLIEGSAPPRYETGLSDWAHTNWRLILDETLEADPRITAAVCVDTRGFLPTHMTKTSREQTGDLAQDTQYCRHGRRFDVPITRKAAQSSADYMMSIYRHEGDGTQYRIMRSVYVPLDFAGKRWGNFQISYAHD